MTEQKQRVLSILKLLYPIGVTLEQFTEFLGAVETVEGLVSKSPNPVEETKPTKEEELNLRDALKELAQSIAGSNKSQTQSLQPFFYTQPQYPTIPEIQFGQPQQIICSPGITSIKPTTVQSNAIANDTNNEFVERAYIRGAMDAAEGGSAHMTLELSEPEVDAYLAGYKSVGSLTTMDGYQ